MTSGIAPRVLLRTMFDAAVASAQPANTVGRFLPAHDGRILVLGAGKAAAAMAAAVEAHWPDRRIEGMVVTRYGHGVPCRQIVVVEAAHPVPDAAGAAAAGRIMALARTARPGDLVVFLISGGASALLALPAPRLTLADKQAITTALLRSGAPIAAMNGVRKHLSAIKGGRLAAAAAEAQHLSLLISDVPGDDPAAIGSGPTVGDPTTVAEARNTLARLGLDVPPAVAAWLDDPAAETPKPGDPLFRDGQVHIVTTPMMALEAAAAVARDHGVAPVILGDAIEGEARDVARAMAADARTRRCATPLVLLSGGETTVTVRGRGRGGRNAEFLLAMAIALDGAPGIHAIACDTDGIDGSENNAGAIIGPDTLARASRAGIDLAAHLDDNDAYTAFAALDDLVMTGPTHTNVNDFRATLIWP